MFQSMIPKIMTVINALIEQDEVQRSDVRTFRAELVNFSPLFLSLSLSSPSLPPSRFLPQDKACEAMELFAALVECDVGIVVPHLPSLIQFCLNVGSNTSLGDSIRVKALSFVSWLVTIKKKVFLH